jgi:predicted TIM-barrel fold metal-dependent hydrolase
LNQYDGLSPNDPQLEPFFALAVESIESADFLTPEQKRDIFYSNAIRFFRLK